MKPNKTIPFWEKLERCHLPFPTSEKPNRLCVTDWNIVKSKILLMFSFNSYLWHIPLSYVTDGRNYSKHRSVSLLDEKSGLALIHTFLIKKNLETTYFLKIWPSSRKEMILSSVRSLWAGSMRHLYKIWLKWHWVVCIRHKIGLS